MADPEENDIEEIVPDQTVHDQTIPDQTVHDQKVDLRCKNFALADERIKEILQNYNEFQKTSAAGFAQLAGVAKSEGKNKEAEALARRALKLIKTRKNYPQYWDSAVAVLKSLGQEAADEL